MRLTLRTLLAYLDRILEPGDAHELEQKVRESDIANQLTKRIHGVLAARDLTALPLDAQGMGRNANSVAEYLDNTLPPAEVPDFERVCLETDSNLAEVAACHQILTLVLGEPAEVPTSLRRKLYRLDPKFAAGHVAADVDHSARDEGSASTAPELGTAAAPVAATAAPSARWLPPEANEVNRRVDVGRGSSARAAKAPLADADEHWTEVPDYLKRPRKPSRWRQLGLVTVTIVLLGLAAITGMGPESRQRLAARLGLSQEASVAEATALTGDSAGSTPAKPPTPTVPDEADGEPGNAAPAESELAVAADTSGLPNETAAADVVPPAEAPATPADAATEVPVAAGELRPNDAIGGENGETTPPAPPAAALADTLAPGTATVDDGAANSRDNEQERPPLDAVATTDTPAVPPEPPAIINPVTSGSDVPTDQPLEAVPALPTRPETGDGAAEPDGGLNDPGGAIERQPSNDVGRFLDRQQVLIKQDAGAKLWYRVPTGARLQVGDTLMSLPTYRVPLVLASGMQVSLVGATRTEVLAPHADGTPNFHLSFGRLLIATFAQAGTRFGLRWDDQREAVLTLADMNTTLAIELQHRRMPGDNPSTGTVHQILQVIVTSGSAAWTGADGTPVQIAAGQRLVAVDIAPPTVGEMSQVPRWVDGGDARPRDAIAGSALAEEIVDGRSVSLILLEKAESKKNAEVRSLAACSLAFLGDSTPLIAALNDAKLYSYWIAQYETLLDVVSLSNESADQVRSLLVQRHGDATGQQIFRVLSGYSPDQLLAGGAAELVQSLDDPASVLRFVANERLKEITGQASLYRANANDRDAHRRAATVRWRKMLDAGEITYKSTPEVFQWLSAAAAAETTE